MTSKYPDLPWKSRLPRYRAERIEHPVTLEQFSDWGRLSAAEQYHLSFLVSCDRHLKDNWLAPWQRVLAVGPFVNRKRRQTSTPFVIIANYRRPYRHLLRISQALAEAYLEFRILPEVFLLSTKGIDEMERTEDIQWAKTLRVSIPLGGRETDATT